MRLIAIKREQAFSNEGVPMCDNFHYSIMPKEIEEREKPFFELMGYEVIEVSEHLFNELIKGFNDMITFQLKVNFLFNDLEKKRRLDSEQQN